jgi:trk system potassium uptake protein TrkH
VLFWRSLTQWIGGMGIIVLTIALFPLLGIGGVELFTAEAPGPTSDKIHPRIKETAKRLWLIYVGLTALLTFLLYLCGMNFYDSINHGLTTMATGGFSTKNDNIAHFDVPLIQYLLTFFMFLAGTNYTIIYFGLKGKLKRVWKSDEFKTYVILLLSLIFFITCLVYSFTNHSLVFFCLLFIGGCAGSTSGGIKVIRHLVLVKNTFLEFKRLLHPRALIRTKVDGHLVAPRVLTHILVFLLIYLGIFFSGSIIMAMILSSYEHPMMTAFGAVATALGNVGPGIGAVGPVDNFAHIPDLGKWFLSFLMLLGRLELFTILILFTPYFWRTN